MYDYRLDKLVSVWIVLYACFYVFRILPWNPLILLCIAYGLSIISSAYIYTHTDDYLQLYYYITLNSFFKLIPLALVYNRPFGYSDVIFTWVFLLAYFAYMFIIQENVICTYRDLITFVMNEPRRPV